MNATEILELVSHIANNGQDFMVDDDGYVYVRHDKSLLQLQVQNLEAIGIPDLASLMLTAYPDSNVTVPFDHKIMDFLEYWNNKHQGLNEVMCGFSFENDEHTKVKITAIKMYPRLTSQNIFSEMSDLVNSALELNEKFLQRGI